MRTRNRSANLPFPVDIMTEILHRLPLKSLLSCKRVSKQWKNLVNDPIFYKPYPHHTPNSRASFFLVHNTLSALFIAQENPNPNPNPPLETHPVPIGLKNMATHPSKGRQLVNSGSCKGIVCVKSSNGIFHFHNLFTGASFAVRNAPNRLNPNSWLCYGFGYDSYVDDYKILVALACNNTKNTGLFEVYSFENRSWKQFEGFPGGYYWGDYQSPNGSYSINGVLHWLVLRRGEVVIVTYDLHYGKFGEITVPDAYGGGDGKIYGGIGKLGELNGSMCYIYTMDYWPIDESDEIRTSEYVVWVMRKYGLEDSWEKLVSIDFSTISEIKQLRRWENVTPSAVYESEDGKRMVLFVCCYFDKWFESFFETKFWYDMKEDKIQVIDKSNLLKNRKLQLQRKREFYSSTR